MSNRISQSFERQMLVRWCVRLAVSFGALFAALHYLAAAWLSEDSA